MSDTVYLAEQPHVDLRCDKCVFFHVLEKAGGPTQPTTLKTLCRRRLHSGSAGSSPEMKMSMQRGGMQPTGGRQERVVSFFPETRPEWWCGDFEPGAPTRELKAPADVSQA